MREHIPHVLGIRRHIVFGAKSSKTFVCQVCSDRIKSNNKNVKSQIEFFVFNKKWVFYIPLYQQITFNVVLYLAKFLNQENSFTTFSTRRFTDKNKTWMQSHIVLESLQFLRNHKRNRTKIKYFRKSPSHTISHKTKNFLTCYVFCTRISVEPTLFLRHRFNIFILKSQAKPIQITSHRNLLHPHFLYDILNCF